MGAHEYLRAGRARRPDQLLDAAHRRRVEIRGGFVQQQYRRPQHARAGDRQPLPLPAGQRTRRAQFQAGETRTLQRCRHYGVALPARHTLDRQHMEQVAAHAPSQDDRLLQHHRLMRACLFDGELTPAQFSTRRPDQPVAQPQQYTLAGAVWPEYDRAPGCIDAERHAADDRPSVDGELQATGDEGEQRMRLAGAGRATPGVRAGIHGVIHSDAVRHPR